MLAYYLGVSIYISAIDLSIDPSIYPASSVMMMVLVIHFFPFLNDVRSHVYKRRGGGRK